MQCSFTEKFFWDFLTFSITINNEISSKYIIQELAELATKATDQAEESEGKFKSCIAEKENLLQKFADEKQELLDKLNQLQDVISDKDQELKVSNHLFCKHSMKGGTNHVAFFFPVFLILF